MKNLQNQIGEYKSIENYAHITIDDVINKVTQEVWELIEADVNWDKYEVYKEAWDVLSNILSVSHELWINMDIERVNGVRNNMELSILLWKWNTKVQGIRSRYSREKVDLNDVQCITKELVKSVLNYSNPDLSLSNILEINTQKFESRKNLYKPEIELKDYIESYSDFPKSWINFKDIWNILKNPEVLRFSILEISEKCMNSDVIVWLDARGFIFWSLVSQHIWKPFIMLRKKWKLPWETKEIDYWLEYWKSTLEIQTWKIVKWQKVSIIDDLLATWWTIKAAIDLVEDEWWIVNNLAFVMSLNDDNLINLESRKVLESYRGDSLVSYE